MNKLFSPDSKFVQILTLLGNLIILNLLWLVTSLPIITVGASTSALYAVVFKYADGTDDEVLKPYFKAFISGFKQSTLLWIPMCLVMVILGVDAYYLLSHGDSNIATWLWIPFFVLVAVLLLLHTYAFPQIARFETGLRDILRNSVLMFILHFFQSIGMIVLNLVPWAMMLVLPEIFAQTGIFWVLYGASGIAYFNARVLLKIFKKHEPEPEDAPEEA